MKKEGHRTIVWHGPKPQLNDITVIPKPEWLLKFRRFESADPLNLFMMAKVRQPDFDWRIGAKKVIGYDKTRNLRIVINETAGSYGLVKIAAYTKSSLGGWGIKASEVVSPSRQSGVTQHSNRPFRYDGDSDDWRYFEHGPSISPASPNYLRDHDKACAAAYKYWLTRSSKAAWEYTWSVDDFAVALKKICAVEVHEDITGAVAVYVRDNLKLDNFKGLKFSVVVNPMRAEGYTDIRITTLESTLESHPAVVLLRLKGDKCSILCCNTLWQAKWEGDPAQWETIPLTNPDAMDVIINRTRTRLQEIVAASIPVINNSITQAHERLVQLNTQKKDMEEFVRENR